LKQRSNGWIADVTSPPRSEPAPATARAALTVFDDGALHRRSRRPAQWLDRVVATIGRADTQPIQVPCGFVDDRHDEYSMV
jgi:hypothetical protein